MDDEEFPAGYPPPERLAPLAPFMKRIIAAAEEYDINAVNGELTTAQEFAEWLRVDVERAALMADRLSPVHRERISVAQKRRYARNKAATG